MKLRSLTLVSLGAMSAIALSAVGEQLGANTVQNVAEFEIVLTLDRSKNGVQMKCVEGCSWKTLSFSCDPKGPDCERSFDEGGTPAE